MPNTFAKVTWVTMESLRRLLNRLEVAKYFYTGYNKEYKRPFAVGETIQPKIPQRWLIRDGMTWTPQDIDRRTTSITMQAPFGVDFAWNSVEKLLDMERGEEMVRKEYIDPAIDQIAQEIDSRCALWAYLHTPNIAGLLGTTPTTLQYFHQARAQLVERACPGGDWGMIISPQMHATLGTNLTAILNPQKEISDLFRKGLLGNAAGFKWHESMSLYTHTAGTMTAADVTVSVAATNGATSIVLASAAIGATLLKGDVISFTTPNAVNPSTRRTTGRTMTVVLTQNCTIGAAGTATAYFTPALYGPGSPYQNVDALPAAGNVVVLFPGTTLPSGLVGVQGLAMQEMAFALVSGTFEEPKAVEVASTKRDPETGISISFIRQFEGRTRTYINRLDCMIGFGNLYNENAAVRVQSLV